MLIKNLFGLNYEPLNLIRISKTSLYANHKYLSSINKNIKIAPVLKSNAYGHGIGLIGREIDKLNPPFICVDSLYEAYELFKNNVLSNILIMGFVHPESLNTKKLPFSYAVFNKELAQSINKFQPHAKIHIFVDTGMHREGISLENLPGFLNFLIKNTNLEIEGLMSHFAMGENIKNLETQFQIKSFEKARKILKDNEIIPKWIHIANSAGILNSKNYKYALGNVARVGKSTYGIDPRRLNTKLKPALILTSKIAQIKDLKKGEKAGYDFTFTASKDIKTAIIPIGYYDGLDRRLSNKGFVRIKGKYCKIIGKISMNITVVDLSAVKHAKVGDDVLIYSDKPSDKNSVQNTAKLCGTIPYEILVHIERSTKRILI